MEAPPGVACMDTRHPRRLLTSGQAQIPHPLIMTKPQLNRIAFKVALKDRGIGFAKRIAKEHRPPSFREQGRVYPLYLRLPVGSVITNDRIARQAKTRLRYSPCNSWMRISSRLRPSKRRPDTAVSGSRVVGVNGRSCALVLWSNQDNPTSAASVTNPAASSLPAGPSFAGRA